MLDHEKLAGSLTCNYINGLNKSLPSVAQSDSVVLSGSEASITQTYAWIEPLADWLLECINRNNPILGICFGHQFIATCLGGTDAVGKCSIPELSYYPIEIKMEHPLFKDIPNPFLVKSAHLDEVIRLPDNFIWLASSEYCRIQGMVHKTKPIVGYQFHPEMNLEEARENTKGGLALCEKHHLSMNDLLERIPSDNTIPPRILQNFARWVLHTFLN